MTRRVAMAVLVGISSMLAQESTVVVAFDLHGVVFDMSHTQLCKNFGKLFMKKPSIGWYACNPWFWYDFYRTMRVARTAEYVYDLMSERYPRLKKVKDEFLAMCNSYTLDPYMVELIDELKASGCRVVVCSNIGHQAFERFQTEHQDVFARFEYVCTSHPDRGYMRKPSPAYFTHFMEQVKNLYGSDVRVVFIDDKEKNTRAAREHGITGIRLKHKAKLRESLTQAGVPLLAA